MAEILSSRSTPELPDGVSVLPASDRPRHYWVVEYVVAGHQSRAVAIGVNQLEIQPRYLGVGQKLFIGAEQGLFVIDAVSGAIVTKLTDLTFVQSIDLAGQFVLVSAEDQILTFDEAGLLLWRENFPDIIEDAAVEIPAVTVTDMSGTVYKRDLATGSRL